MMLDYERQNLQKPSSYWREELAGFDYMLDASPLIIQKLRHHCYHLTGVRDYDYRGHHAHRAAQFLWKLNLLKSCDKNNLFVPESPQLGGFGYSLDGALCNLDTLKFYEAMIGLDKAGFLDSFRSGSRKIVIEIGSGWGGFAYQFKTLFPKTTYVLIDLPQSLLFSGTYLKTLFPSANILMLAGNESKVILKDLAKYDFVFIPHYLWRKLDARAAGLAINMVSFQEMTTAQVEDYASKLAEAGVNLYSLNRDRSPNNSELTFVSSVVNKYYNVSEVNVLDVPYYHLKPSAAKWYRKAAKKILSRFGIKNKGRGIHEYRHLRGTSKTEA